jgi:hypothetical protein
MKKTAKKAPRKKLQLEKETIKELTDKELEGAAGGALSAPLSTSRIGVASALPSWNTDNCGQVLYSVERYSRLSC